MRRSLFFLILFLTVLIGFVSFFGFYQVRYFINRASTQSLSFSLENSYVFLTPLKARASGQEKIRLTVFVLDNRGMGVMGKKVVLSTHQALKIDAIQAITDSFGKAYFDISSDTPGDYYLEVKVDDISLLQKPRLNFY